ncbi:hypothetical protein FF38_11537 [Lucilia cuprina]|uniref:Uncharacterized protein n=1 Tax=Lucilia cuprina TaxID=7375 RepID=A0A0L0CBG0_LUCCU|nr:hypothetical protein FF38_11537 [Lucilia cuprina]
MSLLNDMENKTINVKNRDFKINWFEIKTNIANKLIDLNSSLFSYSVSHNNGQKDIRDAVFLYCPCTIFEFYPKKNIYMIQVDPARRCEKSEDIIKPKLRYLTKFRYEVIGKKTVSLYGQSRAFAEEMEDRFFSFLVFVTATMIILRETKPTCVSAYYPTGGGPQ